MTFLAFVMDNLARTAAAAASTDIDHLAKRRVLDDTLLACTVTVRAGIDLTARFGTFTVTVVTRFFLGNFNFHFRPKSSLLQGDVYVIAQIGASLRPVGRLPAALTAKAAKPSEAALAKTGTGTGSIPILECRRTELVVLGAFLRIRQDAVGFVDFFELFFSCLRIIRVAVRMILKGQLFKSFFYFRIAGVFGNAEHFIIISFAHLRSPSYLSYFLSSSTTV